MAQRRGTRCAARAFAAGERLREVGNGASGGKAAARGGCPWAGTFVRAIALVAIVSLAPGMAQAASAKLSFSGTTLTFPSADPDAVPVIAATENPIQIRVAVNGPAGIISQLSVLAGGDLMSGADRIPIGKVTWTAQGSGFLSGRLSSTDTQLVGQWTGKTNVTGDLRFWLENSWSYAVGDYSQNLVYTLIAY